MKGAVVDAAEPVGIRNAWSWIQRTKKHDRRTYRRRRRPLTLRRYLRAIVPNLREPIFVIGAPRSGTTFLGDAIATLPDVSYHHEPVLTKAAGRYVLDGRWGRRRSRAVFRATYRWLMRLHLDGDLRFAEKTPSHSVLIPFLADAFPDARFVHIVRDGRDAALSYCKKPWLQAASAGMDRREAGGHRYGPYARFWVEPERRAEFESTSDLHRCIWAWRIHTEAALRDGRALGAARYLELRYEDVMRDSGEAATRVLDFLGISDETSRAVFTEQMRTADPRSVGTWRREMTVEDLETVEREAGDLLRELGYVNDGAGAGGVTVGGARDDGAEAALGAGAAAIAGNEREPVHPR